MRKHTVIIGLAMLLLSPLARVEAVDLQKAGVIPDGQEELQDKAKHDACDCCKKCQAAKSPIKSKEEPGASVKDGCEDCCARCGKELKPGTEVTPPEVIDKKAPPHL